MARTGTVTGLLGTCGACERTFRVVEMGGKRVLAKHGYKRDRGFENGECFGSREQPHERSPEVAKKLLNFLELKAHSLACSLDNVAAGRVTELSDVRYSVRENRDVVVTITAATHGEAEFSYRLRRHQEELESGLARTRGQITRVRARVDGWAPRELSPDPRDRARGDEPVPVTMIRNRHAFRGGRSLFKASIARWEGDVAVLAVPMAKGPFELRVDTRTWALAHEGTLEWTVGDRGRAILNAAKETSK